MNTIKYISIGLFIIIIIFVVGSGLFTFYTKSGPVYQINTSSPAVIKQLKSLNRYETASFTIEKIIDAGTSGSEIRELLFGDKLLLIAHGEVTAGFDLASMKDSDAEIIGSKISLNLPAPQILSSGLDNEKTRVYDRREGILTHGDKDLESKARSAAESAVNKAACEGGILEQAAVNGRNQITVFLKALGFKEIIIHIPPARC